MDVLLDIVAETTKDCSISRQIESIHCKNLPSNKIAFFVDYVIHSIHKSQGTRRKRKQEKKKTYRLQPDKFLLPSTRQSNFAVSTYSVMTLVGCAGPDFRMCVVVLYPWETSSPLQARIAPACFAEACDPTNPDCRWLVGKGK